MDIEQDHKKQSYLQFRQLLERASSFTHLAFYSRKLVSPYLISSYGFKKSTTRDGHEQAKCVDCGHSFLLDPIVEEQLMEVKDTLNNALHDHEDGCMFYIAATAKSAILAINRNTLAEYGTLLFNQILDNNLINREAFSLINRGEEIVKGVLSKEYEQMFWKFIGSDRNQSIIYVASLFGWKYLKANSFKCQYCGSTEQNLENFDLNDSHKTFCVMNGEKYWQPVLQKLAIIKLQSKQGIFCKTETQKFAKKLRQQLETMTDESLSKIKQFRFRIKKIKQQFETMGQESQDATQKQIRSREGQKSKQKDNQSRKFDLLDNFAQQIEGFIKGSIKKVKVD